MEQQKYIEIYEFCLEQGWVHNTPKEAVLNDYFNAEDGRLKMFNEHVDKILNDSNCNEINILIGEAPPYYPNAKYPKKENRQYFYDSEHSLNTGYFKEPCKHFLGIKDWENERRQNPCKKKMQYLNELAKKGVLILDIFPFPVFQATDIREKINYNSNRGSYFEVYLNTYFSERLKELIDKINYQPNNLSIKLYLFAPKITSIQFLYWFQNNCFYKYLTNFDDKVFSFSGKSKSKKDKEVSFINKSLEGFIREITQKNPDHDKFIKVIENHPIFMNESGNPDFNKFVNGESKKYNNL